MPDSWSHVHAPAKALLERLVVPLKRPASGGIPMQRRLYEVLRQAILDGRLHGGAALPASRTLAATLGIARNTVLFAYEQLTAEGYVHADTQGTVVATLPGSTRRQHRTGSPAPRPQAPAAAARSDTERPGPLPLAPGTPALSRFPLALWRRLLQRAWAELSAPDLGYGGAAGEPALRSAIAGYLGASRGVACYPEQVFITSGTQESLDICARLLADPGDIAWIEHPGYGGARAAFASARLQIQPVAVDSDGIAPGEALWQQRRPRLIYTTPSHQYPLGVVLSLQRRLELIDRARLARAWLIEDDYDSEFRHDGPRLAAMQGLARDAPVVYLGTFSKTMFPALRLGYIVAPESLVDRVHGTLGELVRRGHPAEQRALARFIADGHFTRHLRRMRPLYAQRQLALREALGRHWPQPYKLLGGSAGMHLTLGLPPGVRDQDLAQRALLAGLGPRPLSAYAVGGAPAPNGLVIGYANVAAEDMASCVRRLAKLIGQGAAAAPTRPLRT